MIYFNHIRLQEVLKCLTYSNHQSFVDNQIIVFKEVQNRQARAPVVKMRVVIWVLSINPKIAHKWNVLSRFHSINAQVSKLILIPCLTPTKQHWLVVLHFFINNSGIIFKRKSRTQIAIFYQKKLMDDLLCWHCKTDLLMR